MVAAGAVDLGRPMGVAVEAIVHLRPMCLPWQQQLPLPALVPQLLHTELTGHDRVHRLADLTTAVETGQAWP